MPDPANELASGSSAIDPRDFRDALGTYATGVTIITAIGGDGKPYGLTCNSFASVVNVGNPNAYLRAECFGLVPQTAVNTPYCDTARATTLGVRGTCPNIRGNLARNMIIGPGLFNLDFSVVKNNYVPKISESFNVQFRAEFFNALNRANFAPPALSPNTGGGAMEALLNSGQANSQFGQLTATQVPNRQIQLALKLYW